MEPESRRLMRAWRDEGVANQVLESEVSAFGHEEQSQFNFKSIYSVHFHANGKQRPSILFTNTCHVREVLNAEEST